MTPPVRRSALVLLAALIASAAGFLAGSRTMLRRIERWHAGIYAAGEGPVGAVSGYARYSRIAACHPFAGERWRVAFDRRYVCHVEREGRQAILHLAPDGSPTTAQVSWEPRTVAEALFEADSVRRAFAALDGELCRAQGRGQLATETWTVGPVRAVIGIDTTEEFGPRISVHAVDSMLAGCAEQAHQR